MQISQELKTDTVTSITENFPFLRDRLQQLEAECRTKLAEEGFAEDSISCETFLHLRYQGTDCALMCRPAPSQEEEGETLRRSSRRASRSRAPRTPRKRGKGKVEEVEEEDDEGEGVEGYGCFRKAFCDR